MLLRLCFLCLLVAAPLCAAAQPVPTDPRRLIQEILEFRAGHPHQIADFLKPRFEAIAREPERFVPFIREIIELPERLEDIDLNDADFAMRFGSANFLLYRGVLQAVGREHAEPILLEIFVRRRPLFEEAVAQGETLREEHRAAGWQLGDPILANFASRFERLKRLRVGFSAAMSYAIRIAGELRSPVLVDHVPEFYEAGLDDRQSQWPRYLFLFTQQRPDIIPRLHALLEDPAIDRSVKYHIREAFEWYATTLAEAEQVEPATVVAESDQQHPAPIPASGTSEGPR